MSGSELQLSADELARMADLCQASSSQYFSVDLDFSGASLALVDALIEKAWPKGDPDAATWLTWGSYLGEVLVRTLGGEWRVAPLVVNSEVALAGGAVVVRPFEEVHHRFHRRPGYELTTRYEELLSEIRQRSH